MLSKSLLKKLVKALWSTFFEIEDSKNSLSTENGIVLDELKTMVADAIHGTSFAPLGPKLSPFDGSFTDKIWRFPEDYEGHTATLQVSRD